MNTHSSGTIAVFDALDVQGGAVIDALLSRGARVRGLVRDLGSDRARSLAGRGVELVGVEVGDAASLSAALKGVDAFFFMTTLEGDTHDVDGETRQGIALIEAAVTAAVPNVVFSSVGGADRDSGVPIFESKRHLEERLEKSGLRATLVRPVVYMDHLPSLGPSVEDGEVVLRMPLPDHIPLQLISIRDIGRISATFLLGAAEAPGGAIEIAGDRRTGSQIAAAFGERAGLPARYEALPLQALDDNPHLQAMFRWLQETPAFQADIEAVKVIEPTVWDLPAWIRSSGWAVAIPGQ
ncbi:NmrA/HSCARG family protein [Streptomyces phaeochromogenes]|uniref:NmrA/HSCARG family protein n=1 Tax=Streptomyces phaeochromogenes TaxID=1923 RepID=A0ABZ1H7G4_STRPH|nr:NmrA/HSCARG family protein [Streptomyces phaeochromogenes]WSD13578.1 NmrA/HSCARG family protein [Streptomyces phaeochromogenes]